MAGVEVTTTVATIRITLSRAEALLLLEFFGTLDPTTAPVIVREIARRFRKATQDETFTTEVD